MSDRLLPRDDDELEQMAGIRKNVQPFSSRDAAEKMERAILGPNWFRRRRPQPDPSSPPSDPEESR